MDFRAPLLLRLDLDTYGGVDSLGVYYLFLQMVADIVTPKLCIIFRGATNERIPIVSGRREVCWVLFCSSFIPASEIFELVENRLYAYADGSTLLAVVVAILTKPNR